MPRKGSAGELFGRAGMEPAGLRVKIFGRAEKTYNDIAAVAFFGQPPADVHDVLVPVKYRPGAEGDR